MGGKKTVIHCICNENNISKTILYEQVLQSSYNFKQNLLSLFKKFKVQQKLLPTDLFPNSTHLKFQNDQKSDHKISKLN